MSEIILCTGGARSGKSTLAEKLALETGGQDVLYVATASVCDEEMEERVRRHRERRPLGWKTQERFCDFSSMEEHPDYLKCRTVLLDCMGFMLNNLMFRHIPDWDHFSDMDMRSVEISMLSELNALMTMTQKQDKNLILVTNEVGMGLVPADRSSRYYRDILGRANQTAASEAHRVYFMVSGIPVLIKGKDSIETL